MKVKKTEEGKGESTDYDTVKNTQQGERTKNENKRQETETDEIFHAYNESILYRRGWRALRGRLVGGGSLFELLTI